MSRIPATIAQYALLVLLLMSLLGAAGCGGAAKEKDDEEDPMVLPPDIFALSGKVLANDGAPVADAMVTARMGDGSNGIIDTAMSAADGAYAVQVPESTTFYLHVEKAAYVDTNSHMREITATKVDVDLVLLLQGQADSLLAVLGGPSSLTTANVMYFVRAVDSSGLDLADVTTNVTPTGLLVFYRLADDTGYSLTGPTVACTAGGGCALPQMAGYAPTVNQGISTFRLTQPGSVQLALVAAQLVPGEITFIANN